MLVARGNRTEVQRRGTDDFVSIISVNMITFLSGGSLVLIENFWYSIPSMYWVWGCEILSTYDVRVMSFTSKRSIHPGIICSACSYFSMLNLKLLNEVQPVDRVNFLALVTISICSPLLANKEGSYGLRVQLISHHLRALHKAPSKPGNPRSPRTH